MEWERGQRGLIRLTGCSIGRISRMTVVVGEETKESSFGVLEYRFPMQSLR